MLPKSPFCSGWRIPGRLVRGPWLAGLVILAACSKDQPEPRVTPARTVPTVPRLPADTVAPVASTNWNAEDGSAIYLPGDGGFAQVVLPPVLDDSVPAPAMALLPATAAPASIDLFAPGGKISTVSVGEFAATAQPEVGAGCDAWPVVPLRDLGSVGTGQWRVAFQAGVATALHADSIGSLPRRDSAQLVVAINRAASLLQLDSAGVLRRVPFSIKSAYQFKISGDIDVVVAVVERRLNMEASPRVERSVLLLERPQNSKTLSAVWSDTQYATEDDLIAVDLLAAVQFKAKPSPTVFLGQDFGDGSRVQMLQRTDGGRWLVRWSSAYTGC